MRALTPMINLAFLITLLAWPVASASSGSPPSGTGATFEPAQLVSEVMHSYNLRELQVVVVENDQVTHNQGYGHLSISTPLTIGSLSKSFTALAIMQLVEQGKIELDEPVVTYLPWFHTSEKAKSDQMTIQMLLNHTSGLGNAIGLQPVYDRRPEISLAQRLEMLSSYNLARQPGEGFEYSNANYMLLGAVVETISGSSYSDYLGKNIFAPLAMGNSTARLTPSFEKQTATGGYWWFGFPFIKATPWYQDSVPAGYIISPAEDMSHYLVALLNDGIYQGRQILSADGIRALYTATVPTGSGESYGMGWIVGTKDGIPAVYHEGDAAGYTASIILDHEAKIGVYVATNISSMIVSPTSDLSGRLFAALHERPVKATGLTTSRIYPIIDLFVLGLSAWMIMAFISLPHWWKRLAEWRKAGAGTRFTRIFLPIVTDFLWPYLLLGFLPQGAGFPMWKVFNVFQPDLSYWIQALAWLAIIKGLVKMTLFFIHIRTRKPPSIARAFRRSAN